MADGNECWRAVPLVACLSVGHQCCQYVSPEALAGRPSWYVDETDLKVSGAWCSLYRALDRDGHLVDARLSATRDLAAAQRFFRQAVASIGRLPERVTTDGHDADPRAIREPLGAAVTHRTSRSRNNRLEQDHRGVKQRYHPMRGCGSVASAARCCPAFEEQRQHFRTRTKMGERISLAEQRRLFQDRWATMLTALAAA